METAGKGSEGQPPHGPPRRLGVLRDHACDRLDAHLPRPSVEAQVGSSEQGVVARFHSALCEILRMLVTVDQLDPTNCVCAELVTRYLVMVEAACDRNPKQPDWEGLEMMIATPVSSRGAAELPLFNSWMSGLQRDRAVVLKQGRLLREERQVVEKRKGGGKNKPEDT